jgi:hypothetical protein
MALAEVDSCRNTPPGGLVGAAPWSRSGLILSPSGADTAARKKLVVDVGLYVLPSPREVLVIRLTDESRE